MLARRFRRLALGTTALAFAVVVLGAWVRLTGAGLGCPDWPGCYGRMVVGPEGAGLESTIEGAAVDGGKAWREMVHRYFAGALGLAILALAVVAVRNDAARRRGRAARSRFPSPSSSSSRFRPPSARDRHPPAATGGGGRAPPRGDGDTRPAVAAVPRPAGPRRGNPARSGCGPPPRSGWWCSYCRSRSAAGPAPTTRRSPARTFPRATVGGGRTGTTRPGSGRGRRPAPVPARGRGAHRRSSGRDPRGASHRGARHRPLPRGALRGGAVEGEAGPGPRHGDPFGPRAARRPGGARGVERVCSDCRSGLPSPIMRRQRFCSLRSSRCITDQAGRP